MAGKATPSIVATSCPSYLTIKECVRFPCMVHSPGLWNYFPSGITSFSLPLLELQMLVIFVITQASHYILKPYGAPLFASQITAGIILGPSLLGRLRIFTSLFCIRSQEVLAVLGLFGHAIYTFSSAVKMDLGVIMRMGRKALCTGILCMLSPLLIALPIQKALGRYWLTEDEESGFPILILAHSVTPFQDVAYLLEHLKILNSELGQLALSASSVSDLLGVFLMCLSNLTKIYQNDGILYTTTVLAPTIAYIFLAVFAFRPAMFWVVRQTPVGRAVKDTYIHTIMLVMFASGYFTHLYHMSFILGPFILGLAVPDGPPLGSTIVNTLNWFNQAVLHPLFVTTCAMRADLHLIKTNDSFVIYNGIFIVVTFVAKMVACLVPPLYSKVPLNDALAFALILSYKGAFQLAHYMMFRIFLVQSIEDRAHPLAIVVMLLNAIVVPILVKRLYDPSRKYAGYQKRDIMHCKCNAELRILVCIHRLDNVVAVIKLLEASCPSTERPLAVYVLHLIELIGRASPIFISHQMQKKTVYKTSYSGNVINAFNQFKQDNQFAALVNIFTAISPRKFMHEDICTMALDKLTSFIVLPFHRKWSIDGSVESEDNTIRTLNCSVLELAPCSVGILVDRGHFGCSMVSSESSYSVAMIFLGGHDDREALTFAKRMANDPNITLTVVHFVAISNEGVTHVDKLLDTEVLKDVKLNNAGDEYVIYLEEIVKDGPQTTLIIRSMVDEYDLIIIGRRHNIESPQTSGLAEWSEFPELGIIGDLLASSDLNSKTSFLVVQQQKST